MDSRTQNAYAKINLYLDVTGKRPDGYHDLLSVMQSVSLCDTVTVTRTKESGIAVTCDDPAVPTDGRNIVVKCAEAFFRRFEIEAPGIRIDIRKRIPSSAGLAGGSSDGAAVLRMLNGLFGNPADTELLCVLGASVGADIPFCLVGGTCVCRGIGEILEPVPIPVPEYELLIAFPGEGVSTPAAFRLLDETPFSGNKPSHEAVLDDLRDGKLPRSLYNAFERAILPVHPGASALRKKIRELGAEAVLMSGSGPSVFGLFSSAESRDSAAAELSKSGCRVHSARPADPY